MRKIYSIIYIPVFILISLLAIFGAYIAYLFTRNPKKANIVARWWGRLAVVTSFTKVELILENFEIGQKYVIINKNLREI